MTRPIKIVRPETIVDGPRQPSQGAHPSVVSVRLDPALMAGLVVYARRHGLSRHEALRLALREQLREEGIVALT